MWVRIIFSSRRHHISLYNSCDLTLFSQIVINDVDLPEYQGDPDYVAGAKAELAAKEIKGPVITEDTSLCFNALNGMPGPYIKWFLKNIGPEGEYL